MSTRHYGHLFALSLIFCFLLSSCETEPIAQNETLEEPLSLNEAFKRAFSLSSFEDPTGHIIENIEVDWHTFQERSFGGKKWYEFRVVQKQPIAYAGDGEIQGQFFTLLAHKNEDGIKFFINKMLSFSAGEGYTYFSIVERHYHGMLYLYNLKGQVEYVHHYEKGELTSGIENLQVDPNTTEKLGLATASRCNYKASTKPCSGNNCGKSGAYSSPTSPCGGRGNGGGNGGYAQVTTHHYTDWYNNRGSYSEYSHTQYNGSSSEWVWVSRGGSSGGSSSRSSQNFAVVSANGRTYYTSRKPSSNSSNPEKIIVDYTVKDNKCVKAVLDQLLTGMNDHLLKSTIGKFVKDPNYNLIFKIGNCKSTDEACTDGSKIDKNGEVTVTLEYTNQSTIGVAALLIHEGIHAELYRYISQFKRGVNPNDKREIFRWYKHYAEKYGDVFSSPDADKDAIDHVYMTQYYINPIANTLRKLDNNRYPLDYYKDYAWDGLRSWIPAGSSVHYDPNMAKLRNIVESNTKKCKN